MAGAGLLEGSGSDLLGLGGSGGRSRSNTLEFLSGVALGEGLGAPDGPDGHVHFDTNLSGKLRSGSHGSYSSHHSGNSKEIASSSHAQQKLAEAANEINAAAIRLARRWTISMLLERPSLLPNRTQPRQLPREEQDQVLQNDTEGLEQRLHRQQMAKIARIRIIRKILLTPLILRIRSFCTKPSSVVGARVELGVEVVNGRIRPNH